MKLPPLSEEAMPRNAPLGGRNAPQILPETGASSLISSPFYVILQLNGGYRVRHNYFEFFKNYLKILKIRYKVE
jgi:hypothetical protein